jgi:hypothetical protein
MSEPDVYKAIEVYANQNIIEEPTRLKKGFGIIETINFYGSFLFLFVLKMNPEAKIENKNMIGFMRTIGLICVVLIMGIIIICPTIIIYNMNYLSPHDDTNSNYVKISNFQNQYIMITSFIWIMMFCTVILFCQIKAI